MMIRAIVSPLLAAVIATNGAAAQDIIVLGGGKAELRFPSEGAQQEVSLFAEVARAGFYGGVLGLVAKDQAATHFELSLGYRHETEAGFTYDLSYTRVFYPNDGGKCCGEISVAFGQLIRERVTLSSEFTYDPDASLGGIEIGAQVDAADNLTVSVNYALAQQSDGPFEKSWDLGVGYALNDETTLDLRYYDGPDVAGYFGIALSFEATLLGG